MDGTLTLTEELHHKAYSQIFKEYGVNFTFEDEITKYAGSGSKNIFTKVFEENGKQVSAEEIEHCVLKKRELYKKIVQERKIPVVPGILDFLKRMKQAGLKMIIATGNSDMETVRFILKKVGLLEFFDNIVSISEVANGKPAPDVFLEAAKRMNLQPSECTVFEDAINGVHAAVAAKMRCIALRTTTKKEDLFAAGATHVVPDYFSISNEMVYGS